MENGIELACVVLNKIASTSSRNEKISILKANNNVYVRFILETAFNPFLTYGVSDIEPKSAVVPSIETLKTVRDNLNLRILKGNDARLMLSNIIPSSGVSGEILKATFEKDLKIGLAEDSILKIFPGIFPKFEVCLCSKLESELEINEGWYAEPKLDGLRCVIIFKNGEATALSRNGKPLYNLDCVIEELKPYCDSCVIDGEILGKDFEDSTSLFRSSKTRKTSDSIKYYMFDRISLSEFESQNFPSSSLENRRMLLNQIPDGRFCKKTPIKLVCSKVEAIDFAVSCVGNGYEGAVIKNPSSKYKFGRSKEWLKVKFEETEDVVILEAVEGEGRNRGRLGAFVCQLENGKRVNVGGGYTDEKRDEFWKNKNQMLGCVIEVKYQEKTPDGSLRFPVFLRVREDKC